MNQHTVGTYPEIIIARRPHFSTVPENVRDEPRAKVTGQVDGIASEPAPASTDTEDEEEQGEG